MATHVRGDRGLVFNIQRFSIHDGPGIRTTVFLKGCPFNCPWCSNPESQAHVPEILHRVVKCIKCGRCAQACPQHAITITERGSEINRQKCDACLQCTKVCPSKAIEATGEYMTVDQILRIVLRDKGYYLKSSGGLTLSGGEPLAQCHFATNLLKAAKQQGLHTTIETTGCAEWTHLHQALQFTDLVLFDFKHTNPALHQQAVGAPPDSLLANLRKILAETSHKVWIRIPLIPGFNSSPETLESMCVLIQNLPRMPEKVSLLPFHKFATGKYQALGKRYEYEEVPLLRDEEIENYRKIFDATGIETSIGN